MADAVLQSSGGGKRRARAPIKETDYRELFQLWSDGASIHYLAAHFSCDWHTANLHLQRARQQMRGGLRRDRDEAIEALRAVQFAAWSQFRRSLEPTTHEEIQRELEKATDGKASPDLIGRIVKKTTKVTTSSGESAWLAVVVAAIAEENRIAGHYDTAKLEAQLQAPRKAGYRVAGRTPEEIRQAMLSKLADVLEQRRDAGQQSQN